MHDPVSAQVREYSWTLWLYGERWRDCSVDGVLQWCELFSGENRRSKYYTFK